MELPHIGQNCALNECNRLDFLPVKCDACSKVFCLDHYRYDKHQCETAKNKDNQVPVCPLCMKPVVGKRDQLPDLAVSQHIDQYCPKNELLKNYQRLKAKTDLQACNYKSCKQKDLIYLECADCKAKFCIKHRHPTDHSCSGPKSTMATSLANNWNSLKDSCSSNASSSYSMIKNKAQQMTKSGQAALNRITAHPGRTQGGVQQTANGGTAVRNLQGNLSEQEALAIAMRESANNCEGSSNHPIVINDDDEDAALARALHESEIEARNRAMGLTNTNAGSSQKDSCVVS